MTSLALLAVSTTIVKFLALNACPLRWIYGQYITAVSPDLYDVQGLSEAVLARFQTEDLVNPKPSIFLTAGLQDDDHAAGVETGVRSRAAGVQEDDGESGARGVMHSMGFGNEGFFGQSALRPSND